MRESEESLFLVEEAMVAIRRRQSRRTLARAHGGETLPDQGALFGVLDLLDGAGRDGRQVDLGAVADGLGVDQPRASKLVAEAVRRGLVVRHADQHDGRRTLLALSGAGEAAVERVHRVRRAAFAAAMSGWTPAERAEFARLLGRFVAGLDRP